MSSSIRRSASSASSTSTVTPSPGRFDSAPFVFYLIVVFGLTWAYLVQRTRASRSRATRTTRRVWPARAARCSSSPSNSRVRPLPRLTLPGMMADVPLCAVFCVCCRREGVLLQDQGAHAVLRHAPRGAGQAVSELRRTARSELFLVCLSPCLLPPPSVWSACCICTL